MALLDEIATHIAASSLASSSGANGFLLFKSRVPDSTALQDKLVAITETAGLPASARVDIEYPGFQIVVRGTALQRGSSGYAEARSTAQSIRNLLHAASTTLSGVLYVGLQAMQEPFLLEYDGQNRPVVACNYIAWRTE